MSTIYLDPKAPRESLEFARQLQTLERLVNGLNRNLKDVKAAKALLASGGAAFWDTPYNRPQLSAEVNELTERLLVRQGKRW